MLSLEVVRIDLRVVGRVCGSDVYGAAGCRGEAKDAAGDMRAVHRSHFHGRSLSY